MGTLNLDKIFNPQTVAIIGASDAEGSVGYAIVKNFTQKGFAGKVYFVNIRKPEIFGIKTYKCIGEIPDSIDLAMIATPAKFVPDVMDECGQAHVRGVIIVSAGFKETGPEGKILEQRIFDAAKKYDIRVIGPNCIGIIRPALNLNATFLIKCQSLATLLFFLKVALWVQQFLTGQSMKTLALAISFQSAQ